MGLTDDLGEQAMRKPFENLVEVDDPVVAVCISQVYEKGMDDDQLYECARGIWKLTHADGSLRAAKAKYVFAVFEKTILEVYKIDRWDDAHTKPYSWRKFTKDELAEKRYEFVGKPAEEKMRKKYRNRQVRLYGPVRYFNC